MDRTRYFLELIGSPHKGFKYVHITGTAGKGTVSTMVHSSLVSANKKAGLFTSPYVTTAAEEIKVGDAFISPQEFTDIVEHLKSFIAKAASDEKFGAPSAFELFLAIAFIHFKRQKCEWVVLEVGLGGRYDCTNAITDPVVTAITNIDYDHTEILGKTLKEIAYDKAGIIKKGCSFFTSEQRPQIVRIFRDICLEKKAVFSQIPKQKVYQEYNMLLARAMAEKMGLSQEAIEKGTAGIRLPGRFETIQDKPTIILDGAHNRAKVRSTISNLGKIKYKRLTVIVALSNTKKDNRAILGPLAAAADRIIVTSFENGPRKSVHPKALLPYVSAAKRPKALAHVILDPHQALAYARKHASAVDCILVTGSFFLAGELRKEWFPEEWVLKNRKSF